MERSGPPLEALTRRLAECPPEFLEEPLIANSGTIHTAAVVSDLLLHLGHEPLSMDEARIFQDQEQRRRKHYQVALISAWLLDDPWFRAARLAREAAVRFLTEDAAELAGTIKPEALVADPDRREELARLCLKAFDMRPAGETVEQAQDRLQTVSSVERQRVIRAARAAEERMQQIRAAMKQKAAEEAALKYGRE
jgi:hypothetical protein